MPTHTPPKQVVILGASGGIGAALVQHYAAQPDVETVHAVSRRGDTRAAGSVEPHAADVTDEASLIALADALEAPDLIILATGILSDGTALRPEKSLKQQSLSAFEQVFAVNTFGSAMAARHLIPRMPRDRRAIFAALSARVGSTSDNGLGGWHDYRASKAALTMLLRNYAIEMARLNPDFVCAGLHPGTVDTDLSRPFSRAVPEGKLFTPAYAADCLAGVLAGLSPEQSGMVFDWAGKPVPA